MARRRVGVPRALPGQGRGGQHQEEAQERDSTNLLKRFVAFWWLSRGLQTFI
jgi:hypothetical protein